MKYLFVRCDENGYKTKESTDLHEFIKFNHYLTEEDFEEVKEYVSRCIAANDFTISFVENDAFYFILWHPATIEDKNSNSKQIVYFRDTNSMFAVSLFEDVHFSDLDEKFDKKVAKKLDTNDLKTEMFFDSVEAESYLLNTLTDDNKYTYGSIQFLNYDSDDESDFGELRVCESVFEAFAE